MPYIDAQLYRKLMSIMKKAIRLRLQESKTTPQKWLNVKKKTAEHGTRVNAVMPAVNKIRIQALCITQALLLYTKSRKRGKNL